MSRNQQQTPPPTPDGMPPTTDQRDGNPGANPTTRNKEAAMQELVTSAVATALKPVASRVDELHQQLAPIIGRINNDPVSQYASTMQAQLEVMNNRLDNLQNQVIQAIDQRFGLVNNRLDAVQAGILGQVGQQLNGLRHDLQGTIGATQTDIQAVHQEQATVHDVVNQSLVTSLQAYNSRSPNGAPVQPVTHGLPPLHNVFAVDELTDHDLDEYLNGYNIDPIELSREEKLRRLKDYIGYAPPSDNSSTFIKTAAVILLMAMVLFLWCS
ncbi:hypothetical protein ID866_3378 [Astraeus odoratus]|nr:hypothetical protein ID866_3378 [Astraeus odoratus]